MNASALLVDFGGTLDADGIPWADRFFCLYLQAGGTAGRPQFDRSFREADARLATLPGVTGFDYSATVDAEVELLTKLLPDGRCMVSADVGARFVADAAMVAGRNRVTLEHLSGSYALAVVSNYQGNLEPCLDELGLGGLFAVVSDSATVGARKPDRRIFDLTLARLRRNAEECWMVGDSPFNDIAAAASLGMKTCWVAPGERAALGIAPTARVARFDQLPALLTTR